MLEDIQNKLIEPLSSRVRREERVVYILVELYKLLEREDKLRDYKSIEFFRNWIAHSKLSRQMAQIVLMETQSNEKYKYEFLSFEILRLEIEKLCSDYQLPSYLTNEGWFQFRKLLASIIRDQPILKNADAKDNDIKEICIKEGPELFKDSGMFILSYSIILCDGKDIGGNIICADSDHNAKLKSDLTTFKFEHHYLKKDFYRVMEKSREIDDPQKSKLIKSAENLLEIMKQYELKISNAEATIAENDFADEYYR